MRVQFDVMRSVPDRLVFSRADLLCRGWSDPAIARAVRSRHLVRLRRGLFTTCDETSVRQAMIVAAAAKCTGSVISHRSAAELHGLPLLGPPAARTDLTVPPGGTGDTTAALVHRARLRPEDVMTHGDVQITSVARTVVDLARSTPRTVAIVALDAALNRRLVTVEEVTEVVAMCRNWPGGRRIGAVVTSADSRSESPLESISRLALARMGLPRPQLQASILNEHGREIGRTDFYWDEAGVVGEADGQLKYTDNQVLVREKLRQEDLENTGLIVVRWGWSDVVRASLLAARVERALERGKRRDANFPRLWSVRWA